MATFNVRESIEIARPRADLHHIIGDYNQWPVWSPWLCAEPACTLTFHGEAGIVGHGYDWKGKVVGSGEMRLRSVGNDTLEMDLLFLTPWKSKAAVTFELEELGDNSTRVSWLMTSKLPFFMFFMKSMFASMIGMDYRRGLTMLKEYAETGKVASLAQVDGIVEIKPMTYMGIKGTAPIAKLGEAMGEAFPKLEAIASKNGISNDYSPIALYTKMNVKAAESNYIAALTTDSANINTSELAKEQVTTGSIEAGRALKITHTGSYNHLGNAWSTGMMHMRAQKLKKSRNQPPFELYINDPESTPDEQLVTEIYLPLR